VPTAPFKNVLLVISGFNVSDDVLFAKLLKKFLKGFVAVVTIGLVKGYASTADKPKPTVGNIKSVGFSACLYSLNASSTPNLLCYLHNNHQVNF
jgi:hypothetical protein